MVNRGLIADSLREKIEVPHVFSSLFDDMVQEQRQRAEKHKWNGDVYPSSGPSIGMCPVKFFENQKKGKHFPLKALVQMEIGKALHEKFLKRAACIPGLLYDYPRLFNRKALEKILRNWPSIYLYMEPFSAEIDLVINICGAPVIADLKFNFATAGEKWEEFIDKQPTSDYKMQLELYGYLANRLGIFNQRVEKLGLLPFNVGLAGEVEGHKEIIWDFPIEREEEIGAWHEHLMPYWRDAVAGVTSTCRSTFCRTHKKKTKEQNEDERSV